MISADVPLIQCRGCKEPIVGGSSAIWLRNTGAVLCGTCAALPEFEDRRSAPLAVLAVLVLTGMGLGYLLQPGYLALAEAEAHGLRTGQYL